MQIKSPIHVMWKRACSVLLLMFFFTSAAIAQMLVRGTIVDQTGESVPGASVQVKGTSKGTISDLDGKFSINVPNRRTILVISFVGYETLEKQVDTSKPMSIVLRENAKELDEVVITAGYQDIKQRDLTGAIGKVDMEGLLKTPSASFDQTLGGRIAGVNVSSGEGMPGGQMNIVIRGNNSLTQSNSPLYVIDGFPIEDPAVAATVNSSDIESVNVLKDASATSIYGARGANGVVIITTKKGRIGKPQIKYDGSFGFQNVSRMMEMMSTYEFVKLQNEISPTDMAKTYLKEYEGKQYTLDDYRDVEAYDWQRAVMRTAWQQNHGISLMGGTEGVRYNASASYFNQDGVILNSNYKRFQTRMNTVIRRGKLNISVTANYSRAIQTGSSTSLYSSSGMNNLFYSVWGYRPATPPGINMEDLINNPLDTSVSTTNDYRFNPILSLKNEHRKGFTNNLQLNGFAEYELIKGLKLKVSGGYTYDARNGEQMNNSNTRYGGPTSNDKVNATASRSQRLTWLNENLLTYQTTIKKHHNLNTMLGFTMQNSDYESYSFKTTHIPNESMGMAGMSEGIPSTTSSLKSSWSMMSYLASIRYNYKSKYYLTASFRADGSSKFIKKNRYGYFPSGSVAWNFSREEFAKKISFLSNGKLRASWGLTGNNRVGEYDTYALLEMLKSTAAYAFDSNTNNVGMVMTSLANANLKWESTEQWNVGIDMGFFRDRVSINLDWYRKTTHDLLLRATLPYTTGFSTAMKNIGKVRNSGIEFTLNTINIKRNGFTWGTNFNIAFNRNKVLALAENQHSLLTAAQFDGSYNNQSTFIARIGQPMGMMYGYIYEGTYKYDDFYKSGDSYTLRPGVPHFSSESNTRPGMPKYKDLNSDGVIDTNDRTVIGRGQPIHTGGFTNDFTYKGFDLSIFVQWSYGNDIMNVNRQFFEFTSKKNLNQFASYANRWTPENPTSNIPAALESSSNGVISSRIIEDGSFLRLKTITLGYTLPKKVTNRWNISTARLYVAAQNLWTLDNYSGYDPEVSIRNSALTPGIDYSSYPRAYTVNFGLNLAF